MKIAIGNDHSAVELKEIIKEFLEEKGYGWQCFIPYQLFVMLDLIT